MQLGKGELGGAINGDKQIQLAFLGAYFSDIYVKVADGILLEALLLRGLVSYLGQTTNPMSL